MLKAVACAAMLGLLAISCGQTVSEEQLGEALGLRDTLSSEKEDLATRSERLAAEVATAERELLDLQQQQDDLVSQVEGAETEFESVSVQVEEASELSDALREQLAEAQAALAQAKIESNAYRNFVRADLRKQNNTECADDIKRAFNYWGVTKGLEALENLYSPASLSFTEAQSEANLLGLTMPNVTGCPEWAWDGRPTFASETAVFNAVCDEVNMAVGRNADRFKGECFIGYGEVVQFDSATGACAFHMNFGPRNTSSWNYDVRGEFKDSAPCDWLDDITVGDEIKFWAAADGTHTYTSRSENIENIPSFRIFTWRGVS